MVKMQRNVNSTTMHTPDPLQVLSKQIITLFSKKFCCCFLFGLFFIFFALTSNVLEGEHVVECDPILNDFKVPIAKSK